MKKIYIFQTIIFLLNLLTTAQCQCTSLSATCVSYESRCAATGAIKVSATGGSGSYKFKTTGPVNTNFTTSDSITGLAAGIYTVIVNDIASNCSFTLTNVIVAGSYQDPRFTLAKIDVSCDNASNGSIIVDSYSYGRAPFAYSIVAPSPMGVGLVNSSGVFTGLVAGDYSIKMTDSCGGIQTRQITVLNYSWWIDSYPFIKTGCDEATGFIKVVDSRGNTSTTGGIPGFMYGIVRSPGDTIWSSNPYFTFPLMGLSTFQVIARDACGLVKKGTTAVSLAASVAASVSTSNYLCNTFSVSLAAGTNFLTPEFCLYNSSNVLISCNGTGVFTGLAYGNYCITAHDACTDTTITRCFSMAAPPISLNNIIAISNKVCSSFTATVTGQTGLTNPEYCLFDFSNVLMLCNSTGIFSGLAYQSYCITIHDSCRDTTITRCFRPQPPTPVIPAVLAPSYITCTNFGVNVGGDSLTLPSYCLYDSSGALIICNTSGVFDSIPLGTYCINIHDSCYDTTFIRCISVLVPVVNNDIVINISHKTCSAFTATVSSQTLVLPEYCLYNNADSLLSCNMTGDFTNIPYGLHCIKAHVPCPDTVLVSCFVVYPALPEVGATVQTSAYTCIDFSATIRDLQNFNNASYCIYDSNNVLISCNMTGTFNNLLYGNYCIRITDDCYDTTITRCFSQSPVRVSLSGTAGKSCSYGWAQFNLDMGGNNGYLPVTVSIYKPDGNLLLQSVYNTNSVSIDSIPGLLAGQAYLIIARDNCGNEDTLTLASTASYFTHAPTVVMKCPAASWANGSGNIETAVATNMGTLNVKIIKKNGLALFPSLYPNTVLAGVYTFNDLGPGNYILCYSANFCSRKLYDTIVISPYQYPNLNRSSAYQCDVNGFSISAVASNGVGPFTYQIIGSQPATPDITTAPQSSPVFTINNGSNYSLIRLRALDACGNATLGDASILPLAINGTVSTFNCLSQPTTLSVDSLYNSGYAWYKKLSEASTDSIWLGSGTSYFIQTVLPSDTGIYVCYVTVNSGCITRTFTFHVDGNCWIVLPVRAIELKGQSSEENNLLTWSTDSKEGYAHFVVERQNNQGQFREAGNKNAVSTLSALQHYSFIDHTPPPGNNIYRLKVYSKDESFIYSNSIALDNTKHQNQFSIYPNPVKNKFSIDFHFTTKHNYNIRIVNAMNQVIKEFLFYDDGSPLEIQRPKGINNGIYILRMYDLDAKKAFQEKIVFL